MKKFIRRLFKAFRQLGIAILNRIFIVCLPLKENRVLFISDVRENIGGNLEFIYNYLGDQYEKVVSFKKDTRTKRNIKDKIEMVKYLSTSKYIFLEEIVQATSYLKVRKGQELIQLWHAAGAYKRFGHSRESTDLTRIHKGYKKYTKAITSSEAIRPCYAEAFGMDLEKVQATGSPRTDLFFDEEYKRKKKEEIYNKYPFLKDKKVILFAPTYRGTQARNAHYDMEMLNLDKIYEKLKNENCIFIFKWHPYLYNNIVRKNNEVYKEYLKYPEFYYDLSDERDINDLLLVTDILITDYSSVIFDYVFMNKPIIYFTYDEEEYINNGRGLYFTFKEYVYGLVTKNDDELISAILKDDMMLEKREVFKEKFLGACDGNSTKKTYEWVFENKLPEYTLTLK